MSLITGFSAPQQGFQPISIEERLSQARLNAPERELISFAESWFYLKDLSSEVKEQILATAYAEFDQLGNPQLKGFSLEYLFADDLVELYHILNSYKITSGKDIIQIHLMQIEDQLHNLCLEDPIRFYKIRKSIRDYLDPNYTPLLGSLATRHAVPAANALIEFCWNLPLEMTQNYLPSLIAPNLPLLERADRLELELIRAPVIKDFIASTSRN